jgi:methyl-accepting chemotaxis protein
MFYFNESGISPSTLDPDQIKKIQTFKSSLGNEGVLYWHYKDPGHFSQILRLHLSRILQEWGKSQQTPPPQTPATPDEPESVDREKVGLLDAMETFLDACLGLKEVSGRISDALNDVGDCMSSRAVELNALRDEHESSRLKSARRVMDKTADDIDRFTLRMRPEIKMFSEHNIKIAESSSTIASLSTEFRDSKENLANIVDGLDQLAAGMSPLTGQIGDLGNSISSLPRASVKFNQSRKAAVKVVDDLVESIDESISVVTEAKALVSQMAK